MTSSMPGDLSYAERRMWFLDRLRPGGTDYLLPYIFRIGGPLRVDALTATLTRLHQRHDVLRCTYRTEAGEPRRVVHPAGESAPALTIVDLTGHAPRERERRAREVLARDQRTPFDLGREHPVRWLLIELTGTDHLLVLTAHHIAFDAWSGHVVFEEFGALYDAEVAGVTPALAPIQVDYATHAVRQRERFLRGELDGSLAFWEGELDGMAALDLPLDHPRPRIWRPDGASVDVSLPPALAKALTALGRSAGATRFMTVLTVFTGLLARLSGQSDISVGTAVSGRDDGRTHETVGLFVNTVVLRSTVEADTTFRDLLGRTVITTLTAMEHPELPFDVLVERLRPERDLSANPLFQAMFLFEEAGGATITAGGLHFEEVDVPPIAAKVDLTLALRHEADGGFTGHFEYATALFERAMIERFARLFVRLAEQAVAEPDRPLVELPLSTAAEHVAELGYREVPPAPVMTPELIAGQARRRPDAIAVAGPDGDLDYRTLARRAGDLAAALARAGVRRGDVVGLCVERGPHLVSALAGIMSSGAAVLWLDPAHPRERLLGLLADGGAVLVVAAGPDRAGLDDCGLPILPADAALPPSGPVPLPRIGPDDVAYIAYTSGSTGRPKGVQISHGALAEHLEVIATEFRITAGARISLAASLGFDVSLEQILTALVRGARVVPLDPRRLGADDLLDEIGRHRLTHLNLTPLYYRELIGRAKPRDRRLESVEMVYLAGDVIRGDDLQRWRDGGFGGAFVCAYGPTEATVTCTAMDTTGFTGRESILPIGRAVPGTRAYVLDGRLQPVPVGVPGELYLAGRRVALGYAGRPAATAGAFLPDPFGAEPGARMYRTGDLVRRRPDGVLEFRGRVDRQIKVRGHRVEPEEVESALLAHPRVRAAAVVHRPVGATGEPGLVAYAVLSDSVRGDAGLGDYLRERLPSYLVPAAIVTLAELPRTSSGKLDHDGLPEPVLIRPDLGAEMVAPRTTAEKALVAAISHVLGIEGVGVHDDFFRLGGNSLAATRLVARLRDHAGLVLPLREVFGTPTAAALAARATPVTGTAGDEPVRADRTGPIVLSAAQRRLWVLHQVDASGWEYVVPATFRLRGPLDAGALRAACRLLAERHEILRTRYVVVPGSGPAQIVDPAGEVPVEVVDPAGRSAEEVVGEAATRGFDLGRDHQFRVTLVRAAPDEHILLLLSHHIAVDGWSWKIIGTELAALYRALTATDPPAAPLPAPAWQYADHAVHEAARDLDDQVAYWRRTLAGSEPLDLPLDRPRPETRDPSGAVWAFRVPAEDARAVLELGRDAGATEFATWFALYAALLSRVTGQRDLVIGTPVDCRGTAGAETVLGCFVNTLAVRVPRVGETFRTHLAAVRSLLAQAHGHREAPFDRVLAELGRDRDPSRTPLFDTMFQVLEGAGQAFSLAGLTVTPVESLPPSAVTDLTLAMRANPDGSWTGELEYATALFEPATVMRLGERFAHLAAEVAARPGAVLADIDLRTERERAATGAPYAELPRTVLELFADQVARVPDAVAVTGPSGSVTYRELDDRSRRLARRLAAAGVEPGAAVAVYAGRSVRTVVALLAVLRRAAVYVPLNEADPPERREALLDETGAVAVVTDEPHATEFAEGRRLVLCDDDQPDDGLITDDPAGAALTDLAYVIFTSGSTGQPKGVMIDHAAFTHHCQVMADAYGLAPGERLALLASLGFDASMDQIMAPLISGAAVVVLDARAVSPAKMLHDLYDHAVTVVDVTPVYYRELLHAAVPDDPRLARLRLMSVGGDVVTGEDALAWHALGTGAAFGCTYGPTEATIACTFLVADEAEARRAGRHPLPLGRPLPGSRLLVLDSDQRPVLPGATGELYAGGPRVARGYLNRPELTADRFVPDPSGPAGARLYRTGDLVRMRPDGVLTFLGRTDRQVKIRGFRVEPAEIEAVLSALPGVRAAAVVPGPLPSGEQGLLGFVVPAAGARLEAAGVRSAVRSRLPRHLVPAALTIIGELPLTPNGKLDQALLLRSRAAPAEQAPDRELDPTERAVAGIWTEVLGLSGLGPGDDFFVLGGHSLSATRAGMRLQEIFGIELPMHRLFTATTVESLAVVVREAVTASLDALSDAEIVALAAQDLEADPR